MRSRRIEERRKAMKMSQSALGRAAGISQATVARLETGEANGSTRLHKIARALSTTPEYLDGEVDDPEADFIGHSLSDDEAQLLAKLRALPERQRDAVIDLIESLSSAED